MNLTEHVERLQEQLAIAAGAAGDEARELAERLTAPLDSAARLILLEALSQAADEITSDLAPGSVEVRLRGGDPEFVVTPPPVEEDFQDLATTEEQWRTPSEEDEGGTARLNLRLPETLKLRIEVAAGVEGVSLNAWLVRAANTFLDTQRRSPRSGALGGDRYTGWVH